MSFQIARNITFFEQKFRTPQKTSKIRQKTLVQASRLRSDKSLAVKGVRL